MNNNKKHTCLWGTFSLLLGFIGAFILSSSILYIIYYGITLNTSFNVHNNEAVIISVIALLGFSGNITGLFLGGVSFVKLKDKPVSRKLSKIGIIINSLFIVPALFSSVIILVLF